MATRMQKMKVGAFLIMCVSLSVSGIILITGLYQERGIPYSIEFDESVLGLYEGGIVQYLGVPVGKVMNIWVTPNKRAHVDIKVNPEKVTLREGVEGQLVLYSLATGTMCVELSKGEPDAKPLLPGADIPARRSLITAISTRMESIIEDLAAMADRFSAATVGLKERAFTDVVEQVHSVLNDGKQFVQNSSGLVDEAKKTVGNLQGPIDDFSALCKDIRKLSKDVDQLVGNIKGKVNTLQVGELQGNLNKLLENLNGVSDQLKKTLAHFEGLSNNAIHEVDNVQYSVKSSLDEITKSFEDLRGLIEQLKEDPSAIVRGKARVKELLK